MTRSLSRIQGAAILACSLCLMLYLAIVYPYHEQPVGDGMYYYHYAASLLGDGDLDFSNNYAFGDPGIYDPYNFRERLTPTGVPKTEFPIGAALLWIPFALVAQALTGAGLYGFAVTQVVSLSSIVYAHLTVLMLADILRRYVSFPTALLLALPVIWLTNALEYAVQARMFNHIPDLLMMTAVYWSMWRWSLGWRTRWVVVAGLAAGLAVAVRPQNAISVAVILLVAGAVWLRLRRPARTLALRHGLIVLAAAGLGVAPLLLSNLALFGTPFTIPQGGTFFRPLAPHLFEGLFSSRNGLFAYSPFLLLSALGLPALIRLPRLAPRLVWLVLAPGGLIFIAQLWLNTSTQDWWGGSALGQRRMISTYIVFVAAWTVAYLASRHWRYRSSLFALVSAAAVLCLGLNLVFLRLAVTTWSIGGSSPLLSGVGAAAQANRDLMRDVGSYLMVEVNNRTVMQQACHLTDERSPLPLRISDAGRETALTTSFVMPLARQTRRLQVLTPYPAGSMVHVGFHVESPPMLPTAIELKAVDAESGDLLAHAIYFNLYSDHAGITFVLPERRDSVNVDLLLRTTHRGLGTGAPTVTISDAESCRVFPYHNNEPPRPRRLWCRQQRGNGLGSAVPSCR